MTLTRLFTTLNSIDADDSKTPAEQAALIKLQVANHLVFRQLGGNSTMLPATLADHNAAVDKVKAAIVEAKGE